MLQKYNIKPIKKRELYKKNKPREYLSLLEYLMAPDVGLEPTT